MKRLNTYNIIELNEIETIKIEGGSEESYKAGVEFGYKAATAVLLLFWRYS